MRLELDTMEFARALAAQWPNASVAPYPCGFADAIRVAIEVTAEQLSLVLPEAQRSEFVPLFYEAAGLIRVFHDGRQIWKNPWPQP